MKQMHSLLKQPVPGVILSEYEGCFAGGSPFFVEDGSRILVVEIGSQCCFKAPAEDHRCTSVFFLPAVHVSIAVLTRTPKVTTNLRVAVNHRDFLPRS